MLVFGRHNLAGPCFVSQKVLVFLTSARSFHADSLRLPGESSEPL